MSSKLPQHVKDWKRVQRLFDMSPFAKGWQSPEIAQEALLDRWSNATWKVDFCGKTFQGKVTHIAYADSVAFTLAVEPEIGGIFELTGWFEFFREVKS